MNTLFLKFSELAREAFAFLNEEFGFRGRLEAEGLLRFEREDMFVLISYDARRSYELTLEIGRKQKMPERVFNFGELLRSVNAPNIPSSYQVTSENFLKFYLDKLAYSLRYYCTSILHNDAMALARLDKLRNIESAEFELASRLRRVREAVDVAWPARDYKAIVKALKSIEPHLSPSEKKRLEYSQKKLSHSH